MNSEIEELIRIRDSIELHRKDEEWCIKLIETIDETIQERIKHEN